MFVHFQIHYPDDREQGNRTRDGSYLAGLYVLYTPVYSAQSQLNTLPYIIPSYDDTGVEGQNSSHLSDLQEGKHYMQNDQSFGLVWFDYDYTS